MISRKICFTVPNGWFIQRILTIKSRNWNQCKATRSLSPSQSMETIKTNLAGDKINRKFKRGLIGGTMNAWWWLHRNSLNRKLFHFSPSHSNPPVMFRLHLHLHFHGTSTTTFLTEMLDEFLMRVLFRRLLGFLKGCVWLRHVMMVCGCVRDKCLHISLF